MVATILSPAFLGVLVANRQLLAVADGRHPVGPDAQGFEVVLGRLGTLGAERDIGLLGAAGIAMTLDLDARAVILGQPVGIGFEDFAVLRANRIVIVLEMDVAERSLAARAQHPFWNWLSEPLPLAPSPFSPIPDAPAPPWPAAPLCFDEHPPTTASTSAAAARVANRPETNRP